MLRDNQKICVVSAATAVFSFFCVVFGVPHDFRKKEGGLSCAKKRKALGRGFEKVARNKKN
jgi:hypothetical protein